MPGRCLTFEVLLVLVAVTGLATGCDGGGAGDEATPTASPKGTMEETTATPMLATATSPAEPTPAPDILTGQPGLRDFLALAGGEVNPDDITYVDLTGDGPEEAVVPVASGGEGGHIAVFVFGYVGRELQELLMVRPDTGPSLKANIVEGALTITEPVFGPEDPLCCPSQLRTTTYRWDGSAFIVERKELTEP